MLVLVISTYYSPCWQFYICNHQIAPILVCKACQCMLKILINFIFKYEVSKVGVVLLVI
jgi:hypothetical protein